MCAILLMNGEITIKKLIGTSHTAEYSIVVFTIQNLWSIEKWKPIITREQDNLINKYLRIYVIYVQLLYHCSIHLSCKPHWIEDVL